MVRIYTTIGPSPESVNSAITLCQHGKGHMAGFTPAVWVHWGSGTWADNLITRNREFMTLCVWCALRSKSYWPDLWPLIDSSIKLAIANRLYERAVDLSYDGAVRSSKAFKEFGPRRDVPGAMAGFEYQLRITQFIIENPESAVGWKVSDVLGYDEVEVEVEGEEAKPGKRIDLTPCGMCDIIIGYRTTGMTGRTGMVSDSVDDINTQIEATEKLLAEIRDQISAMVQADMPPEQIGILQERANDYVGVIAALESLVPVPPSIGERGGRDMATRVAEKAVKEPRARAEPKPMGKCWDGCGTPTPAGTRFVPGHDSKFKSVLQRIERGELKLGDQNSTFQEKAATLPKCTSCGNRIWGGSHKNEKAGIEATPGGPGAANAVGPECVKKAAKKAAADAEAKKKADAEAAKAPAPKAVTK